MKDAKQMMASSWAPTEGQIEAASKETSPKSQIVENAVQAFSEKFRVIVEAGRAERERRDQERERA